MCKPLERIEELWTIAFDAADLALECARPTLGDAEARRQALRLRDERARTMELLSSLRRLFGVQSPSTQQAAAPPAIAPPDRSSGDESVLVRSRNPRSRRGGRRPLALRSS